MKQTRFLFDTLAADNGGGDTATTEAVGTQAGSTTVEGDKAEGSEDDTETEDNAE